MSDASARKKRHDDVRAAERLLLHYGRVVVGWSNTAHPMVWARYRSAHVVVGEDRRYFVTNGPEGMEEHNSARSAAEAVVPSVGSGEGGWKGPKESVAPASQDDTHAREGEGEGA